MKIVKNGRLFGKLNIVDVLILLVVIAAVAFLAVRMVGGSGGECAGEPALHRPVRGHAPDAGGERRDCRDGGGL
mgnify:CR=1 FL=1